MFDATIQKAAKIIEDADAVLITAGAGMGVDSGLPDFRGDHGFWKAYPEAQKRGLSFVDMANPAWFEDDPELAWAFYGHRLHLYRDTTPHAGFDLLLALGNAKPEKYFVVTSNVDGQFQKAGFDPDRILEIHGSIHHLQCTTTRCDGIYPADDIDVHVDMETFKALSWPTCPQCGRTARPNILMFGDYAWDSSRSDAQQMRYRTWQNRIDAKQTRLAIIEMGAGTAVPSIRHHSDHVACSDHATLIRINPRESDCDPGNVPLPMGAEAALRTMIS